VFVHFLMVYFDAETITKISRGDTKEDNLHAFRIYPLAQEKKSSRKKKKVD